MCRSPGGRTVPRTMATAPSERTRISRRAGHLVFGIDDRIAGTVFGTIAAMATVAAYGRAFQHNPWRVEELVASTAVVLWIGHVYAHGLSESLAERRPLRPAGFWFVARRELGILYAAIPPSIALALGGVGVFDEQVAIWLALALGLGILAVEGLRYARIEELGSMGTFIAVSVNVGLGLLVVLLKVTVLH
jgi:hypothetical protein